jgi:hypothetical protein
LSRDAPPPGRARQRAPAGIRVWPHERCDIYLDGHPPHACSKPLHSTWSSSGVCLSGNQIPKPPNIAPKKITESSNATTWASIIRFLTVLSGKPSSSLPIETGGCCGNRRRCLELRQNPITAGRAVAKRAKLPPSEKRNTPIAAPRTVPEVNRRETQVPVNVVYAAIIKASDATTPAPFRAASHRPIFESRSVLIVAYVVGCRSSRSVLLKAARRRRSHRTMRLLIRGTGNISFEVTHLSRRHNDHFARLPASATMSSTIATGAATSASA